MIGERLLCLEQQRELVLRDVAFALEGVAQLRHFDGELAGVLTKIRSCARRGQELSFQLRHAGSAFACRRQFDLQLGGGFERRVGRGGQRFAPLRA